MATSQVIKEVQKTSIFAYLRRSTSKDEQRESLIQQEDGINVLVERLGFEDEQIHYFAETKSGFENKKRKKWEEMIKEIDKLKTPCILIARDTSRLSRNPKDNLALTDRLYGDNGFKQKIEKIFFLGKSFEIIEWNNKTNKKTLTDKLKQNYDESLETREKSINGIIIKLLNGEFPYSAPKGLSCVIHKEKRILKQNEKMPFVKRAFEMKAEGKTHKEISKYLKQYGEIRIGDRDLTDRLFRNAVYIGNYTEKTSGNFFTKLKFLEGIPPIPLALWDKVQKCLGRKISQYGDKQDDHLLKAKIKSESGHIFSKYMAKGIYATYKGKYINDSGEIKFIHIAETEIIGSFMKKIEEIVSLFNDRYSITALLNNTISETELEKALRLLGIHYYMFKNNLLKDEVVDKFYADYPLIRKQRIGDLKANETEEQFLKRMLPGFTKEMFINSIFIDTGKGFLESIEFINEKGYAEVRVSHLSEYSCSSFEEFNILCNKISDNSAIDNLSGILKEKFLIDTARPRKEKEDRIETLNKQKEELEQEKKNYRREALKMGYTKEEIDDTTKDMENDIKRIEGQINDFSENTFMDEYIKKLPNILSKIVELSRSTLNKAKIEGILDDTKKLLEITTVELTIGNKKELKVKLFDVLDGLISNDYSALEAPPGVGPGYKALQASA